MKIALKSHYTVVYACVYIIYVYIYTFYIHMYK